MGVGDACFAHKIIVIDKSGVVEVVDRSPQCESPLNDGNIDCTATLVACIAGLTEIIDIAAHLIGKHIGLGLVWNVANGAAQGAGAVQRALRSHQHFNPLHVVKLEINIERHFTDIGSDQTAAVIILVCCLNRACAQAPNGEGVAAARPLINYGHARHDSCDIRQVGQMLLLDQLTAYSGNIDRDILNGLWPARSRNDHFFEGSALCSEVSTHYSGRNCGRQRTGLEC